MVDCELQERHQFVLNSDRPWRDTEAGMVHESSSAFALTDGSSGLLSGVGEVDETFIGGMAKNIHVAQRSTPYYWNWQQGAYRGRS